MATISSTSLGNMLQTVMDAQEIQPGDEPSYEICKAIFLAHPLGDKIAAAPIRLAQSQNRDINIPTGPEEVLVERFREVWNALDCSAHLLNLKTQARVYGLASIGVGTKEAKAGDPLNLDTLWKDEIFFNVWDPLNTAGLIVDQDPNSPTFQKPGSVRVNGIPWHPSRTKTVLNEQSIYIAWTAAAFSYAGRSVYQRGLYPLKSFIETMRTDDMVARKAGLLVAKMEQPGSIVDRVMSAMMAIKRALLRQGQTNDVLGVSTKESIESLNLQNIDGAMAMARNDIIKNIATSAGDMPAKLLTQESFVEGFGEGTEDAKLIAMYIDRIRIEMDPEYRWFDEIVMRRASSPEFYETIQRRYPSDYAEVEYKLAFYRWRNAFKATWPSLIKEPPSELVGVEDVKAKALIALFQVMSPELDPDNRAGLVQSVFDTVNSMENLFPGAIFSLDYDKLVDHLETAPAESEEELADTENAHPAPPFSGHDSRDRRVVDISGWLSSNPSAGGRTLTLGGDAIERLVRLSRGR